MQLFLSVTYLLYTVFENSTGELDAEVKLSEIQMTHYPN